MVRVMGAGLASTAGLIKISVPAPVTSESPEKPVVTADSAVGAGETGTPPPKTWKFVKNFGVADVILFEDGTTYTFRAIKRNDGPGYLANSYLNTSDKKLAANLRKAARNKSLGVVEVTA